MGILATPLENAGKAVQAHLAKVIGQSNFESTFESIIWTDFFEENGLLFDGKRFQIAMFSPQANLTVYVCNLADGWMSVYENLVGASAFNAYFFRTSFTEAIEHKVFEMKVWRRGLLGRHVRALHEERGWTFLDRGAPLSFENIERYNRRRIDKRLGLDLIEIYSNYAGFGVSNITGFNGYCWHFWRY